MSFPSCPLSLVISLLYSSFVLFFLSSHSCPLHPVLSILYSIPCSLPSVFALLLSSLLSSLSCNFPYVIYPPVLITLYSPVLFLLSSATRPLPYMFYFPSSTFDLLHHVLSLVSSLPYPPSPVLSLVSSPLCPHPPVFYLLPSSLLCLLPILYLLSSPTCPLHPTLFLPVFPLTSFL